VKRKIESEDCVLTLTNWIVKELPVNGVSASELRRSFTTRLVDHVVDALEGSPENTRVLIGNLEIVMKTTGPVEFPVTIGFEILRDQLEQIDVLVHLVLHPCSSASWTRFFRKEVLAGILALSLSIRPAGGFF
jgi:hypothetical protein